MGKSSENNTAPMPLKPSISPIYTPKALGKPLAGTAMLRKVQVDYLAPGMFVVDMPEISREQPTLYSVDGYILDQAEVERLKQKGYTEAFVDYSRSKSQISPTKGAEDSLIKAFTELPTRINPASFRVIFEEEFQKATTVFVSAVGDTKKAFNNLRQGLDMDMGSVETAISHIVTSVEDNPNALVGISNLYSFDEYTFEHSVNVGVLAVSFGHTLGLGTAELEILGMAGLFHDVGKTYVPSDVLNLPRKLTEAEWAVMSRHPLNGYEYLHEVNGLSQVVAYAALEHHERYNGKGYPHGKKGDEINPMARIIAIVDAFDALTAKRVYKNAMLPHKALGLIYTLRGSDFFPDLVDLFAKSQGIYPVGSLVRLSDRTLAIVYQSHPEAPLRPDILVLQMAGRQVAGVVKRSLSLLTYLNIDSCIDPASLGINCFDVVNNFIKGKL